MGALQNKMKEIHALRPRLDKAITDIDEILKKPEEPPCEIPAAPKPKPTCKECNDCTGCTNNDEIKQLAGKALSKLDVGSQAGSGDVPSLAKAALNKMDGGSQTGSGDVSSLAKAALNKMDGESQAG